MENAMGEAIDQAAVVAVPAIAGVPRKIDFAHTGFLEHTGGRHVLSVPLIGAEGPVGALSFERRDGPPFTEAFADTAEALGAMLGGLLELKRRQRRWVSGRLADAVADGWTAIFGPRRASWKIVTLLVLGAAIAVSTIQAPVRVAADAVLEGATQRAAAAPFEGFIAESVARAGDVVAQGDVLARLEAETLELEALRWRSEHARLEAESRVAMATLDRAEVGLLMAQVEQAAAQLALARARLARTEITAPIDGVVISGDLSQRIGTPVQQGETLFEVAPLDDYRVAIQARERDLGLLAVGQTGSLLLAGQVAARVPFEVTSVTSVARVVDGANVFRVEARVDEDLRGVRPGMEGVAKIAVGEGPLIAVWTRTLRHWISVTLWAWTP
jgi:multidrug efflux pump subunit AcrA (membrane-fusion protein)